MACLVTFNNNGLTGVLGGNPTTTGIFEYLGWAATIGGSYSLVGGNFPNLTPAWDDSVDVSAVLPGFYKFKYKADLPVESGCYGEGEFIISVKQGTTDFGADVDIEICSNDAVRNIFDDSGLYDPSTNNPLTYTIAGSGTSSPGYSAGAGGDVSDDEYDPSAEASYPQTIVFTITGTPIVIAGTVESGCTNCAVNNLTVTYTVTESFDPGNSATIAVCNDGDV